jgi:hypothetical protein
MIILSTKLKNQFSAETTVLLKNININGNKLGCSGFFTKGENIVYVNTELCGSLGYLYRTAKHTKDYKGGVNRFAKDIESLVAGINSLLVSSLPSHY